MKPWPKVRLGEVLNLIDRSVPVAELAEVNLAGVFSFGRGLFKRGPISPSETSYKSYNRLGTDDFVISQPKAWEGALARVTAEFNGWFLSPVFPTFSVVRDKLDPRFLEWFCKQEPVWRELQRKSRGIGARRESVSPEQFLSLEIPLPPLQEQRQIVARIEELSSLISEARTLNSQAVEDAEALLISMAHRADLSEEEKSRMGWKETFIHEVLQLVDDSHKVHPNCNYPNLGIFSFGKGLFPKQPINGVATSAKTLRRVKKGQFIYSRLFAFEGAFGMVTEEFDGFYVSNEYPTFECSTDKVRPEFLVSYFKPPEFWKELSAASKGIGDRRQRVKPDRVLAHSIWLPPLSWQNRIADVHDMSKALRRTQSDSVDEIDALLPAILDRAFRGELT